MHNVNMETRHGGRGQVAPGPAEIKAFVRQGMTQQAIVDAWETRTGIRVSRSAIAMAMRRYGLAAAHERPRYEEMLPWHVRDEHKAHNDARMLRLEGRRREGRKLSEKELRWLTQWRQRLEEANAVVMYDPDTEEGFWWVVRTEEDDDIIRRPKDR